MPTNVDLVREIYGLWEHRNAELAFERYLDPDFELRLPGEYPDTERFRGRAGLERWAAAVDDTWSEWQWEVEELIPAGSKVLVLARIVARGKESGAPVDNSVAHVWALQDSRAVSLTVFLDRAEARAAVGLSASGE